MPDKIFTFQGRSLSIPDPTGVTFSNAFFGDIYRNLFAKISPFRIIRPCIDFDDYYSGRGGIDLVALAQRDNVRLQIPSGVRGQEARNIRVSKAMVTFLKKFPFFFNFLKNIHAGSEVAIKAAAFLHGGATHTTNFIQIKKMIDDFNVARWTRPQSMRERQGGVSTLGSISERLLEIALEAHIDNANFFKNTNSEVQSYGDFVLMCLPNNLWLSVKSNYARERLLASGFTTDIIGVGFFTDYEEFTSNAKVRNFQKVGFLAMYVPDEPLTPAQVRTGQSTYSEIRAFYSRSRTASFPLNINGQPFIRKLSELDGHIRALLSEANLKRRTTIGF